MTHFSELLSSMRLIFNLIRHFLMKIKALAYITVFAVTELIFSAASGLSKWTQSFWLCHQTPQNLNLSKVKAPKLKMTAHSSSMHPVSEWSLLLNCFILPLLSNPSSLQLLLWCCVWFYHCHMSLMLTVFFLFFFFTAALTVLAFYVCTWKWGEVCSAHLRLWHSLIQSDDSV